MNVTIENLLFRRGRRTVLDVPRLDFARGRVTALLGPNGSGKSTLLRLISGLEQPDAGTVRFDGERFDGQRRSAAIAFAFQAPVFVSGTLRENFDLALRLRKLPPSERATRIAEAAAACGITPLLDRDANRLSGGESQRANLARALALRAPLTLLDEPLTGLDTSGRKHLLHLLPQLLREFTTTAIVVTHDREEAVRLADDIVVLVDGEVRAAGPKHDVLTSPPTPEVAALLGFTVIRGDGETLAIAPHALRAGTGDVCFALRITSATASGSRIEIGGLIGDAPVVVTTPDEALTVGTTITVSANTPDVIFFERTTSGLGTRDSGLTQHSALETQHSN